MRLSESHLAQARIGFSDEAQKLDACIRVLKEISGQYEFIS